MTARKAPPASAARNPRTTDKTPTSRVTKAKKKPRPVISKRGTSRKANERSLLDSHPTEEQQSIMANNAKVSPFLLLPGEIRHNVYAYALGGQIYKPYKPRARFVCVPQDTENMIHLPLLLVCRQIYSEAAHLPFALCTFEVWPHLVDAWSESLLPFQRDAVGGFGLNWPEACRGSYPQWDLFPSLRRVTVFYSLYRPGERARVKADLRRKTGKPNLRVTFRSHG